MEIRVLGTGCAKCRATLALIEEVARDRGIGITLTKVEDLRDIATYGVMATPGVVIHGKVVHAGGLPKAEAIAPWLKG